MLCKYDIPWMNGFSYICENYFMIVCVYVYVCVNYESDSHFKYTYNTQ